MEDTSMVSSCRFSIKPERCCPGLLFKDDIAFTVAFITGPTSASLRDWRWRMRLSLLRIGSTSLRAYVASTKQPFLTALRRPLAETHPFCASCSRHMTKEQNDFRMASTAPQNDNHLLYEEKLGIDPI